jgi:hypothetical protein
MGLFAAAGELSMRSDGRSRSIIITIRSIEATAAEPVDEQSDHALRTAVILGGHAQACDCMEKFI